MSSTLFMRPVPRAQPPAEQLEFELKKAIARRYWDHDGSLTGDEVLLELSCVRTVAHIEGLIDAGVPGADELLAAIVKHGAVTIWIA